MQYFISPPFSNILKLKRFTNIYGSYTRYPNPNYFWRLALVYKYLTTVRYKYKGIENHIGLKNPGITYPFKFTTIQKYRNHFCSVVPYNEDELLDILCSYITLNVEINLSCPNTTNYNIDSILKISDYALTFPNILQIKLGNNHYELILETLYNKGIRRFHIGNSVNGLSGPILKRNRLLFIEKLKKLYSDIHIIGGGGIYSYQDLLDYKNAGADDISISSVFFYPKKAYKLIKDIRNNEPIS